MSAFVFGVLTLVFSFVPILFPLTALLAAFGILLGGGVLFFEERARGRTLTARALPDILRRPDESALSPPALRSARAIRLAILGLAWNCILYLLLGVHSWLCFVGSFNRELEPIRKALRVIAREPARGAPKDPKATPSGP